MNYASVFHFVSTLSKERGVTCVLIGGFAVNYYKVTRQTVDVDFLITKEGFDKIKDSLKKAGYRQDFAHKDVFVKFTSDKLNLMDIDFIFVDSDTFGKILKDAREISIVGKKFIIPSLRNLIALKLHSIKYNPKFRLLKDFPDIINLVRINKIDYTSKAFKELCLKYGTEEIYQKVLKGL